jgi:hypothetical protein
VTVQGEQDSCATGFTAPGQTPLYLYRGRDIHALLCTTTGPELLRIEAYWYMGIKIKAGCRSHERALQYETSPYIQENIQLAGLLALALTLRSACAFTGGSCLSHPQLARHWRGLACGLV